MISVVLLMAGVGSRMGLNKNKILLEANGKMLFEYPLELFKKYGFEIVCVINKSDEEFLKPYLKGIKYTIGGKERNESVANGLLLTTGDYIMIHDSARVLLSSEVIDKIIEATSSYDAILTYFKVKDTIKEIKDNKLVTLNRDNLIAASTPQCAKRELLINAYNKAKDSNIKFTDDMSLIEYYYPNVEIGLVLANDEDFKVTTQFDYKVLKELLK